MSRRAAHDAMTFENTRRSSSSLLADVHARPAPRLEAVSTVAPKSKTQRRCVLFVESNRDSTVGGSPRALLWMVEGLDRTRFEPIVLFYRDNTMVPVFRDRCETHVIDRFSGFVIARDWPLGARLMMVNRVLAFALRCVQAVCNLLLFEVPQQARLLALFLRVRPHIVHLNNGPMVPECLAYAKLVGAKCLAHYRGMGSTSSRVNRASCKYFDAIICISQAVYEFARNQDPRLTNLRLIYDGVDGDRVRALAKASPSGIRREMNHPPGQPLVGLVNHIRPWKGQHVLVEAMGLLRDRVPELKAVLVGDVSNLPADLDYSTHLNRRVQELGIQDRVYFAGYRSDVAAIFDAMDIVVQSSIANEGFGLVTIEAMSLGKPVVGSMFGPNPELIVDGDCGLLVPTDDPAALAAALESLVRNPDLRVRLGRGARERADRFSLRSNVDHVEKLYEELFSH